MRRAWAPTLVWMLIGAHAALFAGLSVARHRAFATGRFDLGNMVQAVWSTAHGRFLESTDVSGAQFSRLGAHVDPVLALFAPLYMVWSSPEALLVAQAVIVALGALPAFWLGRRWLGDDRLAVAGAAVYLLYSPLQFATLFDFHPATLAAPLLMFCIWAAEEARWWTLGVCATLAALCQEQMGLALVMIALWLAVRHPGRRVAAGVLASAAAVWVAVATIVIIPAFSVAGGNPHTARYRALGGEGSDVAVTLLTRPWEALGVMATPGRAAYLAVLILPLLGLCLLAPLLAAGALPQLLVNLLAGDGPAQTIEFHYAGRDQPLPGGGGDPGPGAPARDAGAGAPRAAAGAPAGARRGRGGGGGAGRRPAGAAAVLGRRAGGLVRRAAPRLHGRRAVAGPGEGGRDGARRRAGGRLEQRGGAPVGPAAGLPVPGGAERPLDRGLGRRPGVADGGAAQDPARAQARGAAARGRARPGVAVGDGGTGVKVFRRKPERQAAQASAEPVDPAPAPAA